MILAVLFLIADPSSEPTSQPASSVATPPPTTLKAAFGDGVTFSVGDKMFELNLRSRIQVRFTHLEPGAASSATRLDEFSVRRARLQIQGSFLHDFDYRVQLGFAPLDMERDAPNPLRDAQITFTRLRDLNIRVGQGKVHFDRTRMTSSSAMSFGERAQTVLELTLDRDIGVEVFSDDLFGLGGKLTYNIGVFGGDGRNRVAPNAGLLYTMRLEYNPFGKFDVRKEGDVKREHRPRLQIAIAGGRNNGTVRTKSTTGDFYRLGGFNYWHATADLSFKLRGFFFVGGWLLRTSELASRTGVIDGVTVTEWSRSAMGAFAQAGMMIVLGLEATLRYGYLQPLQGTDPALVRQHEFGGGLNYYIFGHDLKVGAEYGYLANERLRGNHSIRVQTQLFF